ncbi:translation initiation factor IF-2-like [Pyrgilauda ruficollis]|uniref:translation initiation factor IF-2-like n=1 Tax=Pyrgilauda ruficollis TaxID=221976 RepID=UPI001B86E47D|nr:translation initiation factor IF-2-like [Pyrgilauda ruficollis]
MPAPAAVPGSCSTAHLARPAAPRGFSHSPGRSRAARRAEGRGWGRDGQGGAGTGGLKECGRAPPWPRERFLRRSEGPVRPPPGTGGRVGRRSGGHAHRLNRPGPQRQAPASSHRDPPGGGRPSPRQAAAEEAPHTQRARQGGSRTTDAPTEVKARGPLLI